MGWFDPYSERPWKHLLFAVLDEAGVWRDEKGIVHVPYRNEDGSLFREHLFAPSGCTWWGPGEERLIPFGLEGLPDRRAARDRVLFITEGESDALALREHYAGVTAESPARGYDVLGLPGAATWRAEWRSIVEPWPLIYLLGDGDEAGRKTNERVKTDVPWARPVALPEGEDVRALLQREGSAALEPYLRAADAEAHLWYALRHARDLAHFEELRGLDTRVKVGADGER